MPALPTEAVTTEVPAVAVPAVRELNDAAGTDKGEGIAPTGKTAPTKKATKVKTPAKKVAPAKKAVAAKTTTVTKTPAPAKKAVAVSPKAPSEKIGKGQLAVLKALLANGPLTRAQISEKTGIGSGFTSLLGHMDPAKQEPQSLLAKKLIKARTDDVNGKDVTTFDLMAAGKKIAEAN